MSWVAIVGYLLQLTIMIFQTIKEKNDEKRKQKTEAVQSAARAIIDRDAVRYTNALVWLKRVRET